MTSLGYSLVTEITTYRLALRQYLTSETDCQHGQLVRIIARERHRLFIGAQLIHVLPKEIRVLFCQVLTDIHISSAKNGSCTCYSLAPAYLASKIAKWRELGQLAVTFTWMDLACACCSQASDSSPSSSAGSRILLSIGSLGAPRGVL